MLDYKLLIICICIVIALTLYLFFWNRVVGLALGILFRILFRNQGEASCWVDIGSIHFSLLTGRILFKDFRYRSSNQSVRVVKGQISWRYWIRAPADEEDLSHARVMGEDTGGKPQRRAALSCRLHTSVQGLEWWIYNRTASYDNIVNAMETTIPETVNHGGRPSTEGISSLRKIFSWNSATPNVRMGPPISLVSSIISWTPSVVKRSLAWSRGQLPNFDPKNLLPVSVEITKGAIIIGNNATPTLLVAEFQRSEGTYGIVASRSKHDLYRHVMNLTFQKASICYTDNPDHNVSMAAAGEKLHHEIRRSHSRPLRSFSYLSFLPFAQLWERLRLWNLLEGLTASANSNVHGGTATAGSWGRRRARKALEEETPLGADFTAIEYAKEPKILEAPSLDLLYYADAVGLVPAAPELEGLVEPPADPFDIGNGDLPPEWGVDVAIKGGVVRYGPWADRQRAILQSIFYPTNFADVTPHARLKPGDTRMWTCLKILIELRDGVTLQLPFRETSKNWQWDGEVPIPNRPRKRDAAYIHVKAGDNSTVSYMMPMIATSRGYEPTLNVHLDTVIVTSSLNDIRLINAESCVVRCELPSPLRWNDQRRWTFHITLRKPTLYLLRDHINMFTDLGKDWSSGPPTSYNRFVPMLYVLDIHLENFELNTYVNDHNIIDKPLLRDENALLTLRGTRLGMNVTMPFVKYRPSSTNVTFRAEGPDVAVSLTLPKWNTRSLYSRPHRSADIGRVGFLRLDVSYCYHAEVHPENIDQLCVEFTTRDIVYKMTGWSIRHFMIARNNYFGSFTHFSTLYEYLEKRKLGQPLGDPVDLQYREGSSNSLQVTLKASVNTGLIIMPAGLRGYEGESADETAEDDDIGTCTMLSLPEMQVFLRTHDYYMEMTLNVDTIHATVHSHCSEDLKLARSTQESARETAVIDGLSVLAHRLFGPQPHTTTYLCLWEIHAGAINASFGTLEARILQAASRAFGLNFTDPLNAPAAEYDIPSPPDATFLKISLNSVNVVWHVDSVALSLSLPRGFRMDSNDLAGQSHSKVQSFRVPQVILKVLLAPESPQTAWLEAFEVLGDANADIYSAPPNWREKARIQSEFLAAQDSHTGRAMFLYMPDQSVPYDALAPGRGLLDTEFFLPQLRIPKFAPIPSPSSSQTATHQTEESDARRVPYRLKIQPESEEEEWISEADRDARLARSRPVNASTPSRARDEDDENMSSGDESDNGDLTDPEPTDSEFVTSPASGTADKAWPSADEYRSLARGYVPHHLHRPSWWSGCPYSVAEERAYSLDDRFRSREAKSFTDEGSSTGKEFKAVFDDTSGTTITRIINRKGTAVWLCPLIIPAVQNLLRSIEADQLSTELLFDGILAKHIQSYSLSTPRKAGPTTSVLDVNVASVTLSVAQALQHVRQELPHADENSADMLSSNIATLDLKISQLRTKVSQSNTRPLTFACSFAELVSGIGTPRAFDDACYLSLGRTAASFDEECILVSCTSIAAGAQEHALDHTFATAVSTVSGFGHLKPIFATYRTFASDSDLRLILRTIDHARERTIIDPLSATQPSYLIQNGRPHELRTDVLFKYLIHLRNCQRYLGGAEQHHQPLGKPDDASSSQDMHLIAADHLLQFGADAEDVSTRLAVLPVGSPFKKLFAPLEEASSDQQSLRPSSILRAFSVKLGRVRTALLSDRIVRSEFVVDPFIFSFRTCSTDMSPPQISTATKSTTTLSLVDRGRHELHQFGFIISVGDVAVAVSPDLIKYTQAILRSSRRYKTLLPHGLRRTDSRGATSVESQGSPSLVYCADILLTTRSLKFQAGAENLVIEYKASEVDFCSAVMVAPSSHSRTTKDLSMNHSVTFKEARLQAFAVADLTRPDEYGVLAALIISDGKANVVVRKEPELPATIRSVVGVSTVHVNVPRSAIRLYRFVQEWRADYLPGIEGMVRSLLAEVEQTRHRSPRVPTPPVQKKRAAAIRLEASLATFRVTLQVMRGTWLAWEVGRVLAYMSVPEASHRAEARTFGVQIGTQTFVVSSKSRTAEAASSVRLRLPLPTFSFTGKIHGKRVESLALIDRFSVTVKPSHWDTLLSVQQKFGQDFNDLLSIIAESQQRPSPPEVKPENSWRYRVLARMKGFSVGLDGASCTLFLACDHVGGAVSNDEGLRWHVELTDLALSLAPHSERVLTDSHNRSAFVIIDARAEMMESTKQRTQNLDLKVTKIHAVMQASSIAQIGDFVDHLQAEILIREEQRAQDLADFREKTRSFMRSFEHKGATSRRPEGETYSFLDRYTINVRVMNVGVAFPLALDENFRVPPFGTSAGTPVRAFLFSIKSISFGTQRGETGQASMENFSFQFVSKFRQNMPQDFSGESHPTRNRLVYPEMTAQLRSDRSSGSRQLHVSANVDGFELDIDSTIPDYISSVIEVYRQGKERVDRLAGAVPRHTPVTEIPPAPKPTLSEHEFNALPTSNVFLFLVFRSGRVRMFSQAYSHALRTRAVSTPGHEFADDQIRDHGAEVFKLPVVSVWGEYRATPASTKVSGDKWQGEPSTLIFKSTVHSSQNLLRPTLLPFVTEVVNHVEGRMRKTSGQQPRPTSLAVPVSTTPSTQTLEPDSVMPTSSMRISLSLRIDQSKLELTCQPDVNVVAGVNWDSGGFVINISPGARRVTFTGSVGGLTIGLKHGFLSEDCMKLHARNLAFTVDFAKERNEAVSTMSVVCETEFFGGVRFSRLQDILCFKAVWLDRIPVINAPAVTPGSTKAKTVAQFQTAAAQVKQEFVTLVLVRLRSVELDVDLGQSITSVQLRLKNAAMRTRMAENVSELSFSVSDIAAVASGNLAGHFNVPDFKFQTVRRADRPDKSGKNKMLDLRMISGPVELDLESEYQRLLLYRAEPLEVHISDDWSMFSSSVPMDKRRVRLTFTVDATDIVAIMNVGTVPKLAQYGTKFRTNLDTQREGASRESQAFRISNSPKPDNALSEVADAMFSSARSKLMEFDSGFSYIIGQRLSLNVKSLKLVIFPRSMRDAELAQFTGSEIHAQLDRVVEADILPLERDLQLIFASIAISKLSQLQHGAVAREQLGQGSQLLDTRQWLALLTKDAAEATVFSLPSMDIAMHSEEQLQDGARVLPYDFTSKFTSRRGTGSSGHTHVEDIYITLNMSLYAWLTILRKTFAREMEQVRASAEARPNPPIALGIVQQASAHAQRRKHAESVSPLEREDSLPVADSTDLMLSPPSSPTRPGGLHHTKSGPARYMSMSPVPSELGSPQSPLSQASQSPQQSPNMERIASPLHLSGHGDDTRPESSSLGLPSTKKATGLTYQPHYRRIERLTMRQLGEATPDVMHPFFMKTAGFNLEDSLPQYVHEYATMPAEEIMKALLKLYSKQLNTDNIASP